MRVTKRSLASIRPATSTQGVISCTSSLDNLNWLTISGGKRTSMGLAAVLEAAGAGAFFSPQAISSAADEPINSDSITRCKGGA